MGIERVVNGGFENGFSNWKFRGDGYYECEIDGVAAETGSYGLWIGFRSDHMGEYGMASVSQTVDLSGVEYIQFSVKYSWKELYSDEFVSALWIDGRLVSYWQVKHDWWSQVSYYVGGYSGKHTITIGAIANPVRDNHYCFVMIDNISAYCVWEEPTAFFTVSADSGTAPFTITCYNQSTGNPAPTFIWDFGDGSPTSSERNPTHTYTKSGQFTVQLTAVNVLGNSMFTRTVYVAGLPAVDFRPVPAGGGKNTIVTFKNLTTAYPPVTSWSWWFEGGQYPDTPDSTVFEPQHLYEDEGQYTVRLRGTNSVGTITVTKVNCVTITPDLASRLAIHNVGVVIDGKLFRRGI